MLDEYKVQKFLARIDWFLTTKRAEYNKQDKHIIKNLNELYYLLDLKKYSSLKGYNHRYIIPKRNIKSILKDTNLQCYFL